MEAKDSKGNILKAGDTVKVLRKWGEGESKLPPNFPGLDRMIGNSYSIKSIDFETEDAYLSNNKNIPLCVLEKVQATAETFKVLITNSDTPYWYRNSLGDVFVVRHHDKNDYYSEYAHNCISKSDCHVIEPVWKVMKDAEETGRSVEFWHKQRWLDKTGGGWHSDAIYRLAPEPKQPEYEPYSYEDREKLRGLWVRRKADGAEFMIMAVYLWGVGTNETCPAYQCLFDEYETLDGQPVGKLK